jgi:hypothetical protein
MMKYLGSVSLVLLVIMGAYALTAWLVLPLAVMISLIGMHFPPEKAKMAKDRGIYTKALISSFPIQLAFAALFFGFGRAIGWMLT